MMDSPIRGIMLKCASVAVFTVMGALVKATAGDGLGVPPGQQVFFRSLFAIPVILLWLLLQGGDVLAGLRTVRPMGHFYRGIVGTISMALGFWAFAMIPFPEAIAIGYASPLWVVIFAALLLGERVRLFRLSMVALGLLGVLIVLAPQIGFGSEGPDWRRSLGVTAAFGAAIFAALAQVFVRKLTAHERTSAIVFWFSVTSALLSLLTLPFGWVWPDAETAALLVSIGLLGGLAQIFMTSAYRFGEASLIAPFEYTSMILSVAIGWFFFDEIATPTMLAGAALVILAGMLIIWRERQLGLERARQRRAGSPR